jgi:hypothetical protein
MWSYIRDTWRFVKELGMDMDTPSTEKPTLCQLMYGIAFGAFLMALFTTVGMAEWMKDNIWGQSRYPSLTECVKCRDGFDKANIEYPMGAYFCPNCLNVVGHAGMSLIARFVDWFAATTKSSGRSIEIALSVFNAISSQAPRDRLIEVLNTYADHSITDLMGFGELLEEYDTLISGNYKNDK